MREAVIVAYGRSALGKALKGTLRYTRPEEYIAQVVKGVIDKIPQLDPKEIEDFVLGCAFPEAEQGMNLARIVALRAGLPVEVCGQTVNRFCSSGLQSIAIAANSIIVGESDIVLAGGVESMSLVPMGGNVFAPNPYLMDNNQEVFGAMGITAENVAEKYAVSRIAQDQFSYESHLKAAKAQADGRFIEEIIPVDAVVTISENGLLKSKTIVFNQDEGIRTDTSMEGLANLKSVFKLNGTVTAGNASQMSDGAAAVLMMSADKAKELGIKPIAIFRAFAVAGVEPEMMGIGPVKAIPKVLKRVGLSLKQIDLIELNEAFASQVLACIQELGLDKDRVNVNGGAIAMGHPLGCTGSLLTVKLLSELRRRNGKYGLVSMCIGAGMGAAAVFELVK